MQLHLQYFGENFQVLGHIFDLQLARQPPHIVSLGFSDNLFRSIIRIEHLVIDRRPRLVVNHPETDIPQRHVPVEVLQIIAFDLRLPLRTLQFDTDIDDIDQRCEPLVILVLPIAVLPDHIDSRIPPKFITKCHRQHKQRTDILCSQNIMLVPCPGRKVVQTGKSNRTPFFELLDPPGGFVHRKSIEPIPAALHALVRHFVRTNMPAVIPVELRDIGPAATKYLEDIGQNLVDRLVDGTNMKERKQRMRNIVQPIKKRIHPLDRAKIDRQSLPFADFLGISRNNQPLVGCRFPAQDLPAEPHLTPGTTQRKNLLGGEQARIRGHQAFERSPERLSDRLQKTVVTDLGLLSSYRLTEIIGQQKNPSGHIYFPPPDLRIPQYLLQHGFTSHYPLIVNLYHN